MRNEWLAASSFERAHGVLAAINRLSIHHKLVLAGRPDSTPPSETEEARRRLAIFLERLDSVVCDTEREKEVAVVGVDPRLALLATTYLAVRRQWPQRSELTRLSLADLRKLLDADRREERERLLTGLRELRAIIEQHAHADVMSLLGEL